MSKVKAVTHFVWTEKAAQTMGHIPGEPVNDPYKHEAPREMLTSGYIVDSTEYVGQTDLFSILEV